MRIKNWNSKDSEKERKKLSKSVDIDSLPEAVETKWNKSFYPI